MRRTARKNDNFKAFARRAASGSYIARVLGAGAAMAERAVILREKKLALLVEIRAADGERGFASHGG